MGLKNNYVAYLLWTIGGFFGLHLFYLRRDRHAFIWWATMGGYVGVGWFRDMWKIPDYVDECNLSKQFHMELKAMKSKYSKPPLRLFRFFGMVAFANTVGYLVEMAIPEELIYGMELKFLHVFVPFGITVGIHTVGNIGLQKGKARWPLISCLVFYPLVISIPNGVLYCSFVGALVFQYVATKWKEVHELASRKGLFRRCFTLLMAGLLYISLWTSYFYFNAELTLEGGETIRARDAIGNIIRSPVWQKIHDDAMKAFETGREKGWAYGYHEFLIAIDPQGERSALETLGLNSTATNEEVSARWRELVKKYHPDKVKDPAEKPVAQERFMEIQDAYNRLSKLKLSRKSKMQAFES